MHNLLKLMQTRRVRRAFEAGFDPHFMKTLVIGDLLGIRRQ
ncbi:MAG TPA: hypothetical protein VFX02_00890 [Gammaproteobacteria bacterium]|nr:hypothetical protein [Gammaproteobacteria bacterium]